MWDGGDEVIEGMWSGIVWVKRVQDYGLGGGQGEMALVRMSEGRKAAEKRED